MKKIGPAVDPQYAKQIDLVAAKGAEAISKMAPEQQTELIVGLPGKVADIRSGMAGRLLRRSAGDLEKLISQTHFGETQAAGDRLGDLRNAWRDNDTGQVAKSLAQIATAAGASVEEFVKLVKRMALIASIHKSGGIQNLKAPMRKVLVELTSGDPAKLVEQVRTQLEEMIYRPLREAIDVKQPPG